MTEQEIEQGFINKLKDELKYSYRPEITDLASLEHNFREKFEALNRVQVTDGEFARATRSSPLMFSPLPASCGSAMPLLATTAHRSPPASAPSTK